MAAENVGFQQPVEPAENATETEKAVYRALLKQYLAFQAGMIASLQKQQSNAGDTVTAAAQAAAQSVASMEGRKEQEKSEAETSAMALATYLEAVLGSLDIGSLGAMQPKVNGLAALMHKMPTIFGMLYSINLDHNTAEVFAVYELAVRHIICANPNLAVKPFVAAFGAQALTKVFADLREKKPSGPQVIKACCGALEHRLFVCNRIPLSPVEENRQLVKPTDKEDKAEKELIAGLSLSISEWRLAMEILCKVQGAVEQRLRGFAKDENADGASKALATKYADRVTEIYKACAMLKTMLALVDAAVQDPAKRRQFVEAVARTFAGWTGQQLYACGTWRAILMDDDKAKCTEIALYEKYSELMKEFKEEQRGIVSGSGKTKADDDANAGSGKKHKKEDDASISASATTPGGMSSKELSALVNSSVAAALRGQGAQLPPQASYARVAGGGAGRGSSSSSNSSSSGAGTASTSKTRLFWKREDVTKSHLDSIKDIPARMNRLKVDKEKYTMMLETCHNWTRDVKCAFGDKCEYFHCCPVCWRDGKTALECCNAYRNEHASGHKTPIEEEKQVKEDA